MIGEAFCRSNDDLAMAVGWSIHVDAKWSAVEDGLGAKRGGLLHSLYIPGVAGQLDYLGDGVPVEP